MVLLKIRPPFAPAAAAGKAVLSQLHALIGGGAYPRGGRLPPERELAEQMGVGRPALREAIRALNALGFLETRRGSGTYVKSSRPQNLIFDPLSLGNSNIGVLDVVEVRKMIEPRAAWLAATRATEAGMREIETARRDLEEYGRDGPRLAELDLALHCAVLRAAQNHLILLLHEVLHPLLLKPAAGPGSECERMFAQHAALTGAILRRQPDQAERAMIEHLESWGLSYLAGAPS